jgi:hypothetical protein
MILIGLGVSINKVSIGFSTSALSPKDEEPLNWFGIRSVLIYIYS